MCILPVLDKNALSLLLYPSPLLHVQRSQTLVMADGSSPEGSSIPPEFMVANVRVAEQGAQGLGAWCRRDIGDRCIWNTHSDGGGAQARLGNSRL
jgi:hypothetical protein